MFQQKDKAKSKDQKKKLEVKNLLVIIGSFKAILLDVIFLSDKKSL